MCLNNWSEKNECFILDTSVQIKGWIIILKTIFKFTKSLISWKISWKNNILNFIFYIFILWKTPDFSVIWYIWRYWVKRLSNDFPVFFKILRFETPLKLYWVVNNLLFLLQPPLHWFSLTSCLNYNWLCNQRFYARSM